jgi:hypothetical protein
MSGRQWAAWRAARFGGTDPSWRPLEVVCKRPHGFVLELLAIGLQVISFRSALVCALTRTREQRIIIEAMTARWRVMLV